MYLIMSYYDIHARCYAPELMTKESLKKKKKGVNLPLSHVS